MKKRVIRKMIQNTNISIKDYQTIKSLGSGSFGQVQLVRRKADSKFFAIKSVHLSKLAIKQKNNALNEVRLLASIHIPYVIGYQGAFFQNQTQSLCIVMEYADGGDLQNQITNLSETDQEGFSQAYIWKVAYEILQALKMLHLHKIVHRDIKCANIFFAKGIAKLGDLNVSKIIEKGWCETQTGTPYYTSPQIWKGQKYTQKCDIWSLGCVLYEMCMLSPPFRAKQYPVLFKKVVLGQYPPISNSYSRQIANFIKTCLTVDDNMRPSAQQLLETNNILIGMELNMEKFNKQGSDSIDLIDPIKCPRVLKFLNNRLPKNQYDENCKKKVVMILENRDNVNCQNNPNDKVNIENRKIRSEKLICSHEEEQTIFQCKTKKIIKLPTLQKRTLNQPLLFSNKKIKQPKKSQSKPLIGSEKQTKIL